jgi:hypothetical protein
MSKFKQAGTTPRARSPLFGLRSVLLFGIPFVLFFVVMVMLAPDRVSPLVSAAFFGYAVLIFSVAWPSLMKPEGRRNTTFDMRLATGMLIAAVLFLLITRLIPFFRYGMTPLGYDTGFYLSGMDSAIRGILSGIGHRNTRALIWLPLRWAGIDPIVVLHGLYVVTQFAIAGALYSIGRTLGLRSRRLHAATLVVLFVVSVPQFFAYWWMLYQAQLAIALLLLTIVLLHRRSTLSVFTAVLGAVIHPATFLPFIVAIVLTLILALVQSLIVQRPMRSEMRFLLALFVVAVIIAEPFLGNIKEFVLVYLRGPILEYGWLTTNYPVHLRPQFTGLYINLPTFQPANVYLFPFAAIGVLWFAWLGIRMIVMRFRSRVGLPTIDDSSRVRLVFERSTLFMVYGAILVTLTIIPFIYQHRYLISLDIVLMIFAAYPFTRFVVTGFRDRAGKIMVAILFAGIFGYSSLVVAAQPPQVYPDELEEIQSIGLMAGANEYAMATESQYTPWLLAFSERTVIDPGFLATNRWVYDMWDEFWNGKSDARRFELLTMYDRPMYIFTGRHVAQEARYMQFMRSNPAFVRVGVYVWRFDPNEITDDEIQALRHLEEQNQGVNLNAS